jgi:hypothetical protein
MKCLLRSFCVFELAVAEMHEMGEQISKRGTQLNFAPAPSKTQNPDYVGALALFIGAEEEGFEPPDPVKGLRFSRPVQ